MAEQWYYQKQGVTHGPVALSEIQQLIWNDELQPGDLARPTSRLQWKKVSEQPELDLAALLTYSDQTLAMTRPAASLAQAALSTPPPPAQANGQNLPVSPAAQPGGSIWFARTAGGQIGPLEHAALLQKLLSGEIALDDPLREGTAGDWQTAGNNPTLLTALEALRNADDDAESEENRWTPPAVDYEQYEPNFSVLKYQPASELEGRIVAEFLRRCEQLLPVDIKTFCDAFPHLASIVRPHYEAHVLPHKRKRKQKKEKKRKRDRWAAAKSAPPVVIAPPAPPVAEPATDSRFPALAPREGAATPVDDLPTVPDTPETTVEQPPEPKFQPYRPLIDYSTVQRRVKAEPAWKTWLRRVSQYESAPKVAGLVLLTLLIGYVNGVFSSNRDPRLCQVRGTVTIDGAPLADASVIFNPMLQREGGQLATAITDADGEFELQTRGQRGAYPAAYLVAVTAYEPQEIPESPPEETFDERHPEAATHRPPPVSRIPERYASAETSGFRYTVETGGQNQFSIELKRTP